MSGVVVDYSMMYELWLFAAYQCEVFPNNAKAKKLLQDTEKAISEMIRVQKPNCLNKENE